MSIVIAKESVFCICGVQISEGEQVCRRSDGSLTHLGCVRRSATQGSSADLWTLTSAQAVQEQPLSEVTIGASGPTQHGEHMGQVGRVRGLMSDGEYRTLSEIAEKTRMLETSASARLRDLRKPQFGGHGVTSRLRPDGEREYQVILTRAGVSNDVHENAA